MEQYSSLKAAWHLDKIKALREGRHISPIHALLVISDLCNQDCSFCTYRSSTGFGSENFGEDTGKGFTMNPNRRIPTEKCFEILRDLSALGVTAVEFTGGGEPTTHPSHLEIFKYALDLGLQVGLITNGTKVGDTRILNKLSWIRVSVDAGDKVTYEKLRGSKAWSQVLENISKLAKLDPVLGASFVVTRENYKELEIFCRTMRLLGVGYVKISANLTTEGVDVYKGILDSILKTSEELKTLETDTFKIQNVFSRRMEDLRLGRPVNAFCGQQRFVIHIGGDQKVYRCCNTAYTNQGLIGDLKKTDLHTWFQIESRDKYNNFDARSCEHCQFHDKNEMIAYLTQSSPPHGDFV